MVTACIPLTAIDAQTGHSFPLVSLVSPDNHHDSLFLKSITQLAQAMGIEIKLITADEAYHDKDVAMLRLGCTADGHEYKCNATAGECPRSSSGSQYRIIPFDNGVF